MTRNSSISHYTLLKYIRTHRTDKPKHQPYKKECEVLVACKTVSYFNPTYFFQHSLLHIPFNNINDLKHPYDKDLPEYLVHYASAAYHNIDIWDNNEEINNLMMLESNKSSFISTFLQYVSMLRDTYHLIKNSLLLRDQVEEKGITSVIT